MEFITTLSNIKSKIINLIQSMMFKRIRNAIIYTGINIGGSFIPFLAAILYPKVFDDKSPTALELIGKGEITIMCIPMCISIAFTLYQYKKEIGISKLADFVYIITFFVLIVVSGLYAYGVNKLDSPKEGLISLSMYFLAWTIFSMIFAKYVEDENIENIPTRRSADVDGLETRFNQNRN